LLIPALLALLLETLITTARHWLLPLKKLIDGIIALYIPHYKEVKLPEEVD
jgi:hypothetical protein